jgi:hypothetical protein
MCIRDRFCGDAGLPPQTLPDANVVAEAGGTKYTASTAAKVSVKIAGIDYNTDAVSNPSEAVQVEIDATNSRIRVTLPTPATARINGFLIGATPWKRGQEGPWKQVRPSVRLTLEGTFTATNGSALVTAGIGTKATLRLRAGDAIKVGGVDYTVASVQSDQAFTLTTNYAGTTGAGKVVETVSVVLDYYNEELGKALAIDNDAPLYCSGVLVFNNRLIIYGCSDDRAKVPGNLLLASKAENAEAFPLDDSLNQIQTVTGDAIITVQSAAAKLYLCTRNGVDVTSYTGDENTPFLTRRVYSPGALTPKNAMSAGGYLYLFTGKKAVRISPDDAVDQVFGTAVENKLEQWAAEDVTLLHDPRNAAALYCRYDSVTGLTEIVPWMMTLSQWGTPQFVSGRITDGIPVNGVLYFILFDGTNYRLWEYEGGDGGGIQAWAATEFLYGSGEMNRKSIQRLFFTGKASALRVYLAEVGKDLPDVSDIAQAAALFTLSDADRHEQQIYTNMPPCRSYALRVDLSGTNRYISRILTAGDYLPAR